MRHSILTALALFAGASSTSAATLQVNGVTGKLTGATNVLISGKAWDVSFVDGACTTLFTGCDTPLDFTFQSDESAKAAGQALLDQVLLDVEAGPFDSNPARTFGCTGGSCVIAIPYAIGAQDMASVATVFNLSGDNDYVATGGISRTLNTATVSSIAWARFTASAPSVPEPASWAMMIGGFSILGAVMRRRMPSTSHA